MPDPGSDAPASSDARDPRGSGGVRGLGPDGGRLFLARAFRMLAYGGLAVVLVVYLGHLGLDAATIGLLLFLTLIGDTLISLWLTTHADRLGRRKTLVIGSLSGLGGGVVMFDC